MKRKQSIKSSYTIRIICGLYLLYTDYKLLSGWGEIKANNRFIVAVAVIIFAVFGIFIIATSVRNLLILNRNQADKDEKMDGIETEEIDTEEIETEETETNGIKTDEIKTDEIKTDEIKTDEIKTEGKETEGKENKE